MKYSAGYIETHSKSVARLFEMFKADSFSDFNNKVQKFLKSKSRIAIDKGIELPLSKSAHQLFYESLGKSLPNEYEDKTDGAARWLGVVCVMMNYQYDISFSEMTKIDWNEAYIIAEANCSTTYQNGCKRLIDKYCLQSRTRNEVNNDDADKFI